MTALPPLPTPTTNVLPEHLGRTGDANAAPSVESLMESCRGQFFGLLSWVCIVAQLDEPPRFSDFERRLQEGLRVLGLLLSALFLCIVECGVQRRLGPRIEVDGRNYRRRPVQGINVMTVFGVLRTWRTYYRCEAYDRARGLHPTDVLVGLNLGRQSVGVASLTASFATKTSFEQGRESMKRAIGFAPSTELAQKTVLRLGGYASDYFEQAPAPDGDGDVLVVQLDAKGIPMATEAELEKRRGKRRQNPHRGSPRHRGRARRKDHRRKDRHPEPGTEHKKNARMANVVVMYTLRSNEDILEGPLNKRVWTTFGSKRDAFALAAREAQKRGFDPNDPDARIQVLTDGDPDYDRYVADTFPHAIRTIDFIHVVEHIWEAARALYSRHKLQARWACKQSKRLLNGHLALVMRDLDKAIRALANARVSDAVAQRRTLERVRNYLLTRADWLDYRLLRQEDLELATGAVEGAVKHVVGARFDQGGMRWTVDRAERLMWLRCLDINGQWDDFIRYVQDRLDDENHRTELLDLLRAGSAGEASNVIHLGQKAA